MKRFLKYVEITTKITSVYAFLYTLALLFYMGQPIRWGLTLVFFASMFVFDLATTAINNYIDAKTNGQTLQFSGRAARRIIFALIFASTALGLYLAYRTDILVLLLGALCFIAGILYTYGPVPISRQPLGELLSGVFYGMFIPFLLLYINLPEGYFLSLSVTGGRLTIAIQIDNALRLILFSLIPTAATANIMLANNICDLERDVAVRRYTLPYFLGPKRSLWLFAALYYLAFLSMAAMVAIGMLPPLCLIFLITLPLVQKNIGVFFKEQDKAKTFFASIKNFVVIMSSCALLIFVSARF